METWKDVVGYEGLYAVSDCGKIKSYDRIDALGRLKCGQELSTKRNNRGYVQVHLSANGKQKMKLLHRLVAEAFLENPNNYPQVNHKDENKDNNSVDNLEWCDNLYNRRYGTGYQRSCEKHDYKKIGLSNSKRVRQLSKSGRVIAEYKSITDAMIKTGIKDRKIRMCFNGRIDNAGGYIWQLI